MDGTRALELKLWKYRTISESRFSDSDNLVEKPL